MVTLGCRGTDSRRPLGYFQVFETINYLEALLWGAIAIVFAIAAIKRWGLRGRCLLLALTFLAFAGSDVVEVQTGAWWRPWWLLTWKAGCVLIMAHEFIRYHRRRKHNRS